MSSGFKDKMKIMKALANEDTREKLKNTIIFNVKAQKAREATAICIAEGLGEPQSITELIISSGKSDFLPLDVTVTADGETKAVSSVQPEDAEFDYKALCDDFNMLIKGNDDEIKAFLVKTAELLDSILCDNGVVSENFTVKIN